MMAYTVRQARRLAEKTQSEMAKLLGISRPSYRKIELHPDLATIAQATRIEEVTGIPMDQIFFGKNST